MEIINYPSNRCFLIIKGLGLLAAFLISVRCSSALVIDDFNTGSVFVQGTNSFGVTVLQSGLPTTSVLGGSRSVNAGSLILGTSEVDPVSGLFRFDANISFGYFTLTYGAANSPLGVNLITGGNNGFQLKISDLVVGDNPGNLDFNVDAGNGWKTYSFQQDIMKLRDPGVLVVPFAKFVGADMTQVQAIQIRGTRIHQGYHLAFDSIVTIPEPSAAGIIGIGFILMSVLRSRKLTRTTSSPPSL